MTRPAGETYDDDTPRDSSAWLAANLSQISTRWPLISDPVQFVFRYAEPIQRYLGAIIKNPHDAEEVVQDFLLRAFQHGFVPERIPLHRTMLAQVAGDFATLVSPPTLGSVAINLRFLTKAGLHPALAGASVGVSQVAAFVVHLLLLLLVRWGSMC